MVQVVQILCVVQLLQPARRLQVVVDAVVLVHPRLIVEGTVGVVLLHLVEELVVVALLRTLHRAEVRELHVVVVHVLVVGQLVKLRDFVRHLAGVVVARLRRRVHRVAGRNASAGCRRRAQRVLRGSLTFPRVLLAVLAVKLVVLRVIAEVLPVHDLVKQVLNGRVVAVVVFRLRLAVGIAAVAQLLVQKAADGVGIVVFVGRRCAALEIIGG